MIDQTTISPTTFTESDLKAEMLKLAASYPINMEDLEKFIQIVDFTNYAEYALAEKNLEIIAGGVDFGKRVIQWGISRQAPMEAIKAFEACVEHFPGKMVYYKESFGSSPDHPTLYLNLLEAWDNVFHFLETLPEVKDSLSDFKSHTQGSHICVMLGFSQDKETGKLLVKTYQLFDPKQESFDQPLLISHRLTSNGIHTSSKRYKYVQWLEATELAEGAIPGMEEAKVLLGEKSRRLLGYYLNEEKHTQPKLYIFRKDVRTSGRKSMNSSLYTVEGDVMLFYSRYKEAIESYTYALELNPNDYIAHTNRSFCHALIGELNEAVQDATNGKAFEPDMNYQMADQYIDRIKEIAELVQKVQTAPSAELHSELGVMIFPHGLYYGAKAQFEKALELNPEFAEAHNNLAGASINLGFYELAFEHAGLAISLDENTDTSNYIMALENLPK